MENIRNAISFWEKLYEAKEAKVKFTKKDGSLRIMHCTLDFQKIPPEDRPKNLNVPNIIKKAKDSGIITVYDLEKKGWRNVVFETVDWIETVDKKDNEKETYKIIPHK